MSKCKTVQDENKILELSIRRKSEGKIVKKSVEKSADKLNGSEAKGSSNAARIRDK
jgi:hypothetical protein